MLATSPAPHVSWPDRAVPLLGELRDLDAQLADPARDTAHDLALRAAIRRVLSELDRAGVDPDGLALAELRDAWADERAQP